ncbi:hypothetical protein C8Q77DRAFT_1153951 [Trametes polyzona]|nr:hypothetical protein C8Q77DRAFT_1153951 [Trametes polyzona]
MATDKGHEKRLLGHHQESDQIALLLRVAPVPIIRPLQYGDIPNAVKTSYNAIFSDSLSLYLDSADTAPGRECRQKAVHGLALADHVYRQTAFTIDGGDATLTLGIPGRKRGPLAPVFAPVFKAFDTKELTKRKKEFVTKLSVMLQKAFGDGLGDLIEVQGLATAPNKQGRGYGTALMLYANAFADWHRRGVWLVTTDAYGFYARVGYSVVQEDVLGVDDPKWDGEPVHIRLEAQVVSSPHGREDRSGGNGYAGMLKNFIPSSPPYQLLIV